MKSSDRSVQLADLLDAILDQSRIVIALQGKFANTTEAARRLTELGMPPARVATLLGKPTSHITSALAKARKKSKGGIDGGFADLDGDAQASPQETL